MIYDVIVIGAGPGGYWAAYRAGKEGMNVLLIDDNHIGGVCLNEGCIPLKTYLNSAKIYKSCKQSSKYGISSENITINHQEVLERKNKIIKRLCNGVKYELKASKVQIINGRGKILGINEEKYVVGVEDKSFECINLIIATGSKQYIPNINGIKEGIEKKFIITSREILDIENIPKSLVIIGGGTIGLEIATYFNCAGSKVTILESTNKILGNTHEDISNLLMKNYKKDGVDLIINAKVQEINYFDKMVYYEEEGEIKSIEADKVLICTGRKPNIDGFGLENIEVQKDKHKIITNDCCETNLDNLYAIGDVNGKHMLAHTAYREADVVINNLLGKKDYVNYDNIPYVIYTDPEIAVVGFSEEELEEKNIQYKKLTIPMQYNGKYLVENENGNGIFKVLVDSESKILGVQMVSNSASELIYGFGLMVEKKMKVEDIKNMVFPHPSISEVMRQSIFYLQ